MKEEKILKMIKSGDRELTQLGIMLLAEYDTNTVIKFMEKYGEYAFIQTSKREIWEFVVCKGILLPYCSTTISPFVYFKNVVDNYYFVLCSTLNMFRYKREGSYSTAIEIKKHNI